MTYEGKLPFTDLDVLLRAIDLDRQTPAGGLLIEEKEVNGILLALRRGVVRLTGFHIGTGAGYELDSDIQYLGLDVFDDLLGAYALGIGIQEGCDQAYCDQMKENSGFIGLYSKQSYENGLRYQFDLAAQKKTFAGKFSLGFNYKYSALLDIDVNAQLRHYQDGFAQGFRRHIQHEYLSVEQNDKNFINTTNILSVDDHVDVFGFRSIVKVRPFDKFVFVSDNEFTLMNFRSLNHKRYYYFKHEIGYCPSEEHPKSCGALIYSNRVINTFYLPQENDRENKQFFKGVRYLGLEAKIEF